jgi:hypothetical protein
MDTRAVFQQLFLLPVELQTLTGFKLPARQVAWLESRGWIFETDRNGRPRVARSYFDGRMTGQPLPGRRVGPRTDFLFK